MAEKYQLVGMVNPTDRIDQVQYNKAGDVLVLNGEPKALTPSQVEKISQHVVLRKIDEGTALAADFINPEGEKPEDSKGESENDAPKLMNKPVTGARG